MPLHTMKRPSDVQTLPLRGHHRVHRGGNNSGSIRDDYDNPEDLWEDNRDWYEDEDEAWDEWYDD